jgi:Uma2 family endonuclease
MTRFANISSGSPSGEAFREARSWKDIGHLLLVVEVLAPATARYDRGIKRRHYQAAGVPEYWVVDPDAQLIERWRPEDERPEIIRERMTWHPDGASMALDFALEHLFAAAPAE